MILIPLWLRKEQFFVIFISLWLLALSYCVLRLDSYRTVVNFQDRTQLCPVGSKQMEIKYLNLFSNQSGYSCRGGSRIFLGGGALVSCSTSTPINHIVFFCRIPVVLENRRSSRVGGGVCSPCTLPLDPPLSWVRFYGLIFKQSYEKSFNWR